MKLKFSSTYAQRAIRAKTATASLKNTVAAVAVQGLQEATFTELYAKTRLPVTGKMQRSIGASIRGNTVIVGYRTSIAPHAPIRVNMKGISKLGGHDLSMDPGTFVIRRKGKRLQSLVRGSILVSTRNGVKSIDEIR